MGVGKLFSTDGFSKALQAANTARDRKDWATALANYKVATSIRPHRASLFVQAGNMAKELGDYVQAEGLYLSAIRHSGLDEIHLQLGHLEKLRGRMDAALFYYTKAASENPDNVNAQTERSAAEAQLDHGG